MAILQHAFGRARKSPGSICLNCSPTSPNSVKRELTEKDPRKAGLILELVAQAVNQIQTRTRERSAIATLPQIPMFNRCTKPANSMRRN